MRIIIFFLLFSFFGKAQILTGTVLDQNNSFIVGATIYMDGSSIATLTNEEGKFKIDTKNNSQANLIISHIGYKKVVVENPMQYTNKDISIKLEPETFLIEEITIKKSSKKSIFSRKKMLQAFRESFLGRTTAGMSCKILNEEDIIVYFEEDSNSLIAYSYNPLKIINKHLEYEIIYTLTDFTAIYKEQTLDYSKIDFAFYQGNVRFIDKISSEKTKENRKNSYLGSSVHLMKSLSNGTSKLQGFDFYEGNQAIEIKDFLKISDSLDYKKVSSLKIPLTKVLKEGILSKTHNTKNVKSSRELKEIIDNPENYEMVKTYFNIVFMKKKYSQFYLKKDGFNINQFGEHIPITEVIFGGDIAHRKLGDLIPYDYIEQLNKL